MRGTGSVASRYAPFIALACVQLLLVVVAPSRGGGDVDAERSALTETGQISEGSGTRAEGGGSPSDAVVSGTDRTSRSGGTALGGEVGGVAGAGDRSKCAPGGKLQQKVTRMSPPCVPRFVGNNGGATSPGVTGEKVTIVYVRSELPEFIAPIFVRGGLASTRAQDEEHIRTWGKFFEKHFEFYGRKIEWIVHSTQCSAGGDPNPAGCLRQEARRIKKQYNPYAVFALQVTLKEFFDELGRLRIVNLGTQHISEAFNIRHRPYHWDLFVDGDRLVRNLADYWCKRLVGKPASRAGDPIIQQEKRKLGVIAEAEAFDAVELQKSFSALVTGAKCGSSDNKPVNITFAGGPPEASQQFTAAASTFKGENVTTVVCLCTAITPVFMTQAFDDQQYFPEHLLSGGYAHDEVALASLYTPTQWRNAFGPSFLPVNLPEDNDAARAWRDGGGEGEPCTVCGAVYLYMEPLVFLIQWTGPNLTPQTMESAAFAAAPIGGWERTGHDPTIPLLKFGPTKYSAVSDSKEVWWNTTGGSDGGGAYVYVRGGQRYELEKWPRGEPLQ